MSYYYQENRTLTEVTLPINCEKWHMSAHADPDHSGVMIHNHEPLEIIVVLSGSIIWTADTRTYHLHAGDVLLFNPYVLHAAELTKQEDVVYLGLTFSISAVLSYQHSVLSRCAADITKGISCFDEFYPAGHADSAMIAAAAETISRNFHIKTPESECEIIGCLYRIMTILIQNHYREENNLDIMKRNKHFLQELSLFLEQNFHLPITAKDAANALFLSPSRFSHVFHQHYGTNFQSYLCQYRIHRAAVYYTDSTLPITEIAQAVGFSDYCYFSRSFKKYIGKTPAVYYGRWKTPETKRL